MDPQPDLYDQKKGGGRGGGGVNRWIQMLKDPVRGKGCELTAEFCRSPLEHLSGTILLGPR